MDGKRAAYHALLLSDIMDGGGKCGCLDFPFMGWGLYLVDGAKKGEDLIPYT